MNVVPLLVKCLLIIISFFLISSVVKRINHFVSELRSRKTGSNSSLSTDVLYLTISGLAFILLLGSNIVRDYLFNTVGVSPTSVYVLLTLYGVFLFICGLLFPDAAPLRLSLLLIAACACILTALLLPLRIDSMIYSGKVLFYIIDAMLTLLFPSELGHFTRRLLSASMKGRLKKLVVDLLSVGWKMGGYERNPYLSEDFLGEDSKEIQVSSTKGAFQSQHTDRRRRRNKNIGNG
jgi:hypothetical protein